MEYNKDYFEGDESVQKIHNGATLKYGTGCFKFLNLISLKTEMGEKSPNFETP